MLWSLFLHKERSLHPPTKPLFQCLTGTDLCVGVVIQPLGAVLRLFTTGKYWKNTSNLHRLHQAISFTLFGVSVFTSSAISLDRLQVLFSGLRYRHAVTLPRVRAVIICFWLIGLSYGSMFFWKNEIAFTVALVLVIISVLTSVFSYTKVYRKLRQHQLQAHLFPQGQPKGRQVPLNIGSTLQEVRFQRVMGAVGISYLLYSFYCCGYAQDIWRNTCTWKEIWNSFRRRCSNPYLLKIVS